MRTATALIVLATLVLSGCSDDGSSANANAKSGINGRVHIGPQCPVMQEGVPCPDKPAANATVTVSKQLPGEAYAAGEQVATAQADGRGFFRLALAPGAYVVTADAGMSCELMDVRVAADGYAHVDVPCDSGIR